MEALEAIRKRRSVREYTGEPIPRQDLETIVDAGRLAATGGNRQPWEFVVVTERAMIDELKVRVEEQAIAYQQYLKVTEKDEAGLREEYREGAENRDEHRRELLVVVTHCLLLVRY